MALWPGRWRNCHHFAARVDAELVRAVDRGRDAARTHYAGAEESRPAVAIADEAQVKPLLGRKRLGGAHRGYFRVPFR
jgi:hypothetical protein